MINDATIIEQTQQWVSSVIVGLNFCPFAKRELEKETIHFQVSHESGLDSSLKECLHEIIDECKRLDEHPQIKTTLLIFATAFENFDDYLDFVELANGLMIEQGYEGIYQLASFHPRYCFEGEDDNDAANYTNRSPYPMLHLLREDSLEQALENYPDPESIPERNIVVAREKGLAKMKKMLESCIKVKDGKDA